MNDTFQDTPTTSSRPTRWLPAAAAAVVLVLAGVAGAAMLNDDDAPPAAAPEPAMELTLPDPNMMSSCLEFSVEFLADMPTAFSGSVVETGNERVVLDVDKWYRGGDAGSVELVNPSTEMTSIDGVEFVEGDRYLVTASEDGTVNSCGYTMLWNEQQAADFETAFGK